MKTALSNVVVATALATLAVALPVVWQRRGCAIVGPQIAADGTITPGSVTCGPNIADKVVGAVDNQTGPVTPSLPDYSSSSSSSSVLLPDYTPSSSSSVWEYDPTTTFEAPTETPKDTATKTLTTTVSTQTVTVASSSLSTSYSDTFTLSNPEAETTSTVTVKTVTTTASAADSTDTTVSSSFEQCAISAALCQAAGTCATGEYCGN